VERGTSRTFRGVSRTGDPRRNVSRAVMALCFCAVLVGLSSEAPAGEASWVGAGSRVRVTLLSSGDRIVGRIVEADDDAIVLRRQKGDQIERLRVPRLDIRKLEVSQRRSRRGRGAGIGALVGVGTAVVLGVVAGESCSPPPTENSLLTFSQSLDSSLCFSHAETALLTAIVTIPVGALLGAAIAPGESWRPVDDHHLMLSVGPASGGGVSARVTLRF
jgi:hypothetical protein